MNWQQLNLSGGIKTRRHAACTALAGLLLALLSALTACGGDETATPATPPVAVTVETGGMVLSDAASGAPADATTVAPAAEEPLAPTPTEQPILAIGAAIVTSGPTSLYAEPDRTSPRFAEYAAGSQLTVIEPDGDYGEYPPLVDGQRWYRVRAEDGLVGWVTGV